MCYLVGDLLCFASSSFNSKRALSLSGVGAQGSVAVMSFTGFFVLPAMQVLILEDFKHMSGLTAGISKLVMTLISVRLPNSRGVVPLV
jgi:hypothetical protein